MAKIVEKEVASITAKCQRYQERQGYAPRWVEQEAEVQGGIQQALAKRFAKVHKVSVPQVA